MSKSSQNSPTTSLLEDDDFVATPCRDCDVPGYLVLVSKHPGSLLSDLPLSARQRLGNVLATLEQAVQETTGAQHVYVVRFSEGLSSVHFHIFPRVASLAHQWANENKVSAKDGVNGPLLFAWARIKFFVKDASLLSSETLQEAVRVRDLLKTARSTLK